MLKEAIARALASRPELAESSINMDINKLNVKFYRDQMKPQINAFATFAAAGLAGTKQTANPFGDFPVGNVPPHLLGGNGQSLSNLWEGRYPTAKVGLSISLPLRNRTAAGNAANAIAESRRLEVVKKQMEMLVEADVRNALEEWNSARVRHDAAIIARKAAEAQYASEQRQFQAGTSTMFLVFQRQTTYISARSNEVRARADLAEAIANMDRATAHTIDTHGIKLDQQ
jgi:HAE1 family hydrophobic/amphiphilic exporter-1